MTSYTQTPRTRTSTARRRHAIYIGCHKGAAAAGVLPELCRQPRPLAGPRLRLLPPYCCAIVASSARCNHGRVDSSSTTWFRAAGGQQGRSGGGVGLEGDMAARSAVTRPFWLWLWRCCCCAGHVLLRLMRSCRPGKPWLGLHAVVRAAERCWCRRRGRRHHRVLMLGVHNGIIINYGDEGSRGEVELEVARREPWLPDPA